MSTRKKILIFSLAYFPKYVGGAEVAIKEITDRIPDVEFHMVTLSLAPGLPKKEKVGNIIVHRVGFGNTSIVNKFVFQFLAAWKGLSLHRGHRFDALWAVMAHSSGVPAAIFKSFQPRVPFVLTLQEGDPPRHIERTMLPLWPLFSRAFKKADVVQAISTFLGHWAKYRGFRGEPVLIPNAVNTKHFSYEFRDIVLAHQRDELGKKMGDVFLVTTSRLVKKNAVDDVIRAMPLLQENVHFVVFGVGPDERKLKDLIAKLHLENRVHMLGEFTHKDIPLLLQSCDIFVRPSRSEGMGNSFVEAMAAGLPVIATQEGGIAEFLFDEKRNPDKPITGFAVDTAWP